MKILTAGGASDMDFSFAGEVAGKSGQPVSLCFQCERCTSGCPVTDYADYTSSQVIRLLLYGQKNTLLKSRILWLCSGCETCGTRCPNGISAGRVIGALKEMAAAGGNHGGKNSALIFHREFLGSVRANGRVHEGGMMVRYKLKSGRLFSDLKLGLAMFRKGKLAVLPARIKDRNRVRRIFENVEKLSGTR